MDSRILVQLKVQLTARLHRRAREGRGTGIGLLPVRQGKLARLQRAVYDAIQAGCPREPDHVQIDYSHGRIIRRSPWVTDAAGMDFPHVTRAVRIRRDGYDAAGALLSKVIVHAVTSLGDDRAGPADQAKIARGQWGIDTAASAWAQCRGRYRGRGRLARRHG
jgi:hypothetical protein